MVKTLIAIAVLSLASVAQINNGGGGGGTPTTRSLATTAPLGGGGDLSADRTFTCTTCATTTNGGAVAGTANQIAVSAAGVFSITSPFTFPGSVSIPSASTLDWNSDTFLVRDALSVIAVKNGTTAQSFRVYDSTTGPSYIQLSDSSSNAKITSQGTSSTLFFNTNGADRWEINASGHFFPPTSGALDVGVTGGAVRNVVAGGGYTVQYTATAALTAGQVVKIDTANPTAVIVAATTDTGAGVPIGIVINSPGIAGNAEVLLAGQTATPLLGTGTCATLGQFVIVDTTTAGRVKCTATFTAGTVIGKVTTVQSSVGSAVGVLVQPE